MAFVADVVAWLTSPSHWHGVSGIPHRLGEHLAMSAAATAVAASIAVPLGVALGHNGRRGLAGTIAVNVSNVGRALPSFGILVLFALAFGLRGWPGSGARPALVALVALAAPPMVTKAYVGVRDLDPQLREAAQGMGMTGGQLLWQVELPLATPLLMAGLRTSAVQVVATATLAAVTGWGGLGRYIIDGFGQRDDVQVFAGAVLVAAIAILTELTLGWVQRLVVPTPRVAATQEQMASS